MDLIALQGMQRYRTARAPDEIGRVGADDKGTFFANRMLPLLFFSACHVPSWGGNSLTCEGYDFYLCCRLTHFFRPDEQC